MKTDGTVAEWYASLKPGDRARARLIVQKAAALHRSAYMFPGPAWLEFRRALAHLDDRRNVMSLEDHPGTGTYQAHRDRMRNAQEICRDLRWDARELRRTS